MISELPATGVPWFLSSFELTAVRLWLKPETDMQFHGFPGRTLRSAFGRALKATSCRTPGSGSGACECDEPCAYVRFFKPARREGVYYLDSEDLPAGVIVRFPFSERASFRQGDAIPVDVIMIGAAADSQDALANAIHAMVSDFGLGRSRVKLHPYRLEALSASGDGLLKPFCWADFCRNGDGQVEMAELLLCTPLEIRRKGEYLSQIDFHDLVWHGAHRLAALIDTHCGSDRSAGMCEALKSWRDELATASREVRRVACAFVPDEQEYRSSGDSNRASFPGFTGRVIFQGNVGRFLPLLRALEFVGVGRHSTFGWGQTEVCLDLSPG